MDYQFDLTNDGKKLLMKKAIIRDSLEAELTGNLRINVTPSGFNFAIVSEGKIIAKGFQIKVPEDIQIGDSITFPEVKYTLKARID